jgi:acrylyl-CoA reductase (NADPH)
MKAVLVEDDDHGYRSRLLNLDETQLPEGNVTVRVQYSTVNFKDGLAITGRAPVVGKFPMVPGIDLAGIVEASTDPRYEVGDAVILNGCGIGETHWGGFAEKARVDADWLVPLPKAFTPKQAMAIGTAGYSAMLCVMALERQGVTPGSGEMLVTGAAGGLGSVTVTLLSGLGYTVVAVSGRPETAPYLKDLGATEVIPRSEFLPVGKALLQERWAGAVDVVGGQVLANVCASIKNRGVVTVCGMAGGMDFPATVAPFIVRGIVLVGIDSVTCPMPERLEAWSRLERQLDVGKLEAITSEIPFDDVLVAAKRSIAGKIRGRLVVKIE